MSLLKIENLTQRFGEKIIYEETSLTLNKGERMGLTGANGVGKSTLIKILTGEILPDEGRIQLQKNCTIGYLDQYAAVEKETTIDHFLKLAFKRLYKIEELIQQLYQDYSQTEDERLLEKAGRLQSELDDSDFYQIDAIVQELTFGLGIQALGLAKKVSELSGGQRSKVILAKLLLEKPDILLLDEPTNYLDDTHIQWLTDYLNHFTGSFILVSHDYSFLNGVTTCIGDIEFGKITKYTGNLEKAFTQKKLNKENYLKQYHAQQEKIKKAEAYIRKYKAGNRATMAKSREKQLARLERLAPPGNLSRPVITFPYQPITASLALTTFDLVIGYQTPLLPKINLSLHLGEKIILKGFNGIGKSTLIKTLTGQLAPLGGEYQYPLNTAIAYFAQDLAWENTFVTPLSYLSDCFPKKNAKELRSHLARCGLPDKLVSQPIDSLSGGEQTKVKLCRLTLEKSNLIFFDEPTNHIDQTAKEALKRGIQAFPGTVVLVSHEESFYQDWADRMIDFEAIMS